MGVATEIGDNLARSGNRCFGVNDSVGAFEICDKGSEDLAIGQRLGGAAKAKLSLLSGMSQELQIFGPEDLGERFDREQEAFLRRAPRLPVRRQAATGD